MNRPRSDEAHRRFAHFLVNTGDFAAQGLTEKSTMAGHALAHESKIHFVRKVADPVHDAELLRPHREIIGIHKHADA